MIRIGTDIEELARIKKVNRDHRLAKRILSESEYDRYQKMSQPIRQLEFLAGRFCAKEAIIKALNCDVYMNQIDLCFQNDELIWIKDQWIIKVSISHTKTLAMASALAYENH